MPQKKKYLNLQKRWAHKTTSQENENVQDPVMARELKEPSISMEVEGSAENRRLMQENRVLTREEGGSIEGQRLMQEDRGLAKEVEVVPIVGYIDKDLYVEEGLKSQNEKSWINDEDDLKRLVEASEEQEKLNSVKRRKMIIEEFDPDLLEKKINLDESTDDDDHYVLIKRSKLVTLIEDSTKCKLCGGSKFKMEKGESKLDLSTPNYILKCQSPYCIMQSSSRACNVRKLRETKVSDIIARFGLASIDSGIGYDGLATIFSAFDLPVPSKTQVSKTVSALLLEIEAQGKLILDRCKAVVHKYYKKYISNSVNDSGKALIIVSFDGSWKTRGSNSPIGIGFVVDMETNLIVDFHVLCNFCQICALKKSHLSDDAFNQWKKKHQDKGECDQNFPSDLSSGSMEPEIANILWERSIKSNLWYKTMVADGDSRSFTRVKELSPYGDISIEKEECHNHMSKRMRRALTNLSKDEGLGVKKEGKGALTDKKVDEFAKFYSVAIKKNVDNVKEMKKSIYASFLHHAQTSRNPTGIHCYCPNGKDSWCFQKKADHKNEKAQKSDFKYPISTKVLNAILASRVFKDLTSEVLLKRCTGKTQNVNESLHSRVWKMVPKDRYKGVKYVKIAMWLVMVKHNLGVVEQGNLLKEFNTPTKRKIWEGKEKRRQEFSPNVSKVKRKLKLDGLISKKGRKDYNPGGGD